MTEIEANYRAILSRIADAEKASGRSAGGVTLLAVSKVQPTEKIEALYRLGHRDFGENYVQELAAKAVELERRGCTGIRWHFIGHLQTNKAKMLIPHVHSVHSVDSAKVATALAKAWKASGRAGKLPVFVEVNVSVESTKTGADPSEVPAIIEAIAATPELECQGLMCVPAATETPEQLGQRFDELKALDQSLKDRSQHKLSMGMSSDFELAIRHGSTHVRVGTAIFGKR